MRLIRALFPHPTLSLLLTAVWVAMANTFTINSLVLGAMLGVAIPIFTRAYWPDRPRLRSPLRVAEYAAVVLWDIVMANIAVARLVLFRRNADLRPAWIAVPLDLRHPEAITALAGTITMTPGTVSCDVSSEGRALLVHCLHAPDPDAVRDEIKQRYERRLMEIFE
ncbi:Na+/H+ antiporter subunit E [Oceanicella actignis]|uniref:Multicomponent K+:H+ antiporter subunit E n=1 Tax=Oceanicella actignis TaxID=1189325 RepID=A0A1M7SHR5_9RHOB|nr:Na+/H+ antiporter subunit E [Oceanicella actignis]TYO91195.1 multicomponent K+:H+ antiporter subunit E [Oceanicella actignis]SET18679.1 multisubunit potassium/proton antiporter, PhaE subunit [Oceanicella actignis]SHN58046.1 multicomponent K+:H+ antiporter subunit E [Oceanicella actignis]